MNIVLDTNCLLMSLSRRSRYYSGWRNFVDGNYTLCITNEILSEYEEILTQKVGAEIASNVIKALLDLPNTKMVQIYYHLRLITSDPDDDKFVDCAFKLTLNTLSPKIITTMCSSRPHSLVVRLWILTNSLAFCIKFIDQIIGSGFSACQYWCCMIWSISSPYLFPTNGDKPSATTTG